MEISGRELRDYMEKLDRLDTHEKEIKSLRNAIEHLSLENERLVALQAKWAETSNKKVTELIETATKYKQLYLEAIKDGTDKP